MKNQEPKLRLDDNGLISIFASKAQEGEIAKKMINDIVCRT